jgi:hypothetical protein
MMSDRIWIGVGVALATTLAGGVVYAAKSFSRPSAAVTGAATAAPPAAATAGPEYPKAASTSEAAPTGASIDPEATAALTRMGNYLRTLKDINLRARVTQEEVMLDGQKTQRVSEVDVTARRPNRLRATVKNDRQPRNFYYDGKTFTMFAPSNGFYAQAPAPATIATLSDELEAKFGIQLPLVDLFRWGTSAANLAAITSAIVLTPNKIDGVTTDHYAFRQKGADWQLWVQEGEHPLPRKLVITTTSDEARPQYTAEWTWNTAPSIADREFTFTPPKGAKKITFKQVETARAATKNAQKARAQ